MPRTERSGARRQVKTPMAPADVRPIIPLLPYQREDVMCDARFNWCCWSRQVGKSFTKSLRRLLRGLARRRNQILLSAGERQSRELMLKVRQHCQALQIACRAYGEDQHAGMRFGAMSIELPNGVRVIGLPANPATARGFTGDVLLDEFAMHEHDREIWAALFPALLRGDGELDVASTPRGADNMFARLRDNAAFRHSTVTLADAVRAGLKVDPEEIRRSMNDDLLYRQEFCCEFLDEANALLTYEQIARVEDPGLGKELDPVELARCTGPLYCGVDIGRVRDLTVLWVVEFADGVLVTRGVRESQGEPFASQQEALHDLLKLRQVVRCCIDAGGMGMPLAEAAVEAFGSSRVEPVTLTLGTKDELATRLRLHVEQGTIRIPADAAIRGDWHAVRRTVTSVGPARYDADRTVSGHADRFWAACLAVRAAGAGAGIAEAVRGPALRFARAGVW